MNIDREVICRPCGWSGYAYHRKSIGVASEIWTCPQCHRTWNVDLPQEAAR